MGVSFASVNRWKNGQLRPSALAWQQIDRADKLGVEALSKDYLKVEHASVATPRRTEAPTRLAESPINIDFSTDPEVVRAVAEGERLAYGHLINPAFATETSLIDPLPHQRIAVYEHMLHHTRLRFLLADGLGQGVQPRERYWLYVVYDCASPHPRLLRVQDPFVALLVRMRSGVVSMSATFLRQRNRRN